MSPGSVAADVSRRTCFASAPTDVRGYEVQATVRFLRMHRDHEPAR